jgi:hypothetical protein
VSASKEWTCAKCGGTNVEASAMTRLDERYSTGFCNRCTVPKPKVPRKKPRRTSDLVRTSLFDRTRFEEQRRRQRLSFLIAKVSDTSKHLSGKESVAIVALYDEFGDPGWAPTPALREAAKAEADLAAMRRGRK